MAVTPEERRFYREQLNQLTNAYNPGGRWSMGGASDHSNVATAGGGLRQYPRRGLNLKYGETANDKQLEQFINQQKGGRRGPNRGLSSTTTETNNRKTQVRNAVNAKEKKDAETALEKFFREAEEKIEEANGANEKRYNQIMGDLDARYGRVMDRIQNFGHAARADLQERAAEALGNIHANLSARGLGNSTILAAFQQRNARDLAREQQRLSETVDTRAMNADMQMTADKAGFMERREDVAPDWGQIQEMAMRYGQGNEGRGFNSDSAQGPPPGQQGVVRNDYRNQGGGSWVPPPGAVAAGRNRGPQMLGGFNPQGILNNMAGMGGYDAPWNAPVNKSPANTDVSRSTGTNWDQFDFTGGIDYSNAVNMSGEGEPGRESMGVTNRAPGRASMGIGPDQDWETNSQIHGRKWDNAIAEGQFAEPGRSGMGLQSYPYVAPGRTPPPYPYSGGAF